MKHEVSSGETNTRSVKRAAEILRLLGMSVDDCSLTELARGTSLSKATAYRILQTLAAEGLVDIRHDTGRYTIGADLVRIALAARKSNRLLALQMFEKLSAGSMRALRDRTRETVALVIRQGECRTNIAVELGTHELIAVPRVGTKLPLHLGGPGKLLLALLPESELQSFAQHSRLSQPQGRIFVPSDAVQAELHQIRELGYAKSFGEAVEGQASIAAPIRQSGAVIAALNLIVPTVRFDEARQTEFLPHVLAAAAEISAQVEGAFDHNVFEWE
jgi:DNA-binding IclR family transcriptional regulator